MFVMYNNYWLSILCNKLISVSSRAVIYIYLCVFFAYKCEAQIYFLAAWLLDSVGGDIHRGAFSGTFMRDFFHGWKEGDHTQQGCLSAMHTHVCVFVRTCTSLRAQAPFLWALLRGLPGMCFASCFVSVSPPPCCGSVAGSSGSSTPVLRQCY